MNGQVAEHDGYFACNLLARAIFHTPEQHNNPNNSLSYPGLSSEIQLNNLSVACYRMKTPPVSVGPWDEFLQTYTTWRNTFGSGADLWNDNNFGPPSSSDSTTLVGSAEFIAGPFVTTEAGCLCLSNSTEDEKKYTELVNGEELSNLVTAMLETMFLHRNASTHEEAKMNERTNRLELNCIHREVNIDSRIDLSALSVSERLSLVKAPIGVEKAQNIIQKLLRS